MLGSTLFAYALLFDALRQRLSQRPRRRCPRCWYDLSATPGRTCSECGYEAKRERQLKRGRRRWRLALAALLVLTSAHGLRVTPAVRDRGWPAAVPTTALILAVPFMRPRQSYARVAYTCGAELPPGLIANDTGERAFGELTAYRLNEETPIWHWQARLLQWLCRDDRGVPESHVRWDNPLLNLEGPNRSLRAEVFGTARFRDGSRLSFAVRPPLPTMRLQVESRDRWPIGTPVYVSVHAAPGRQERADFVSATPLTPGLDPIELTFWSLRPQPPSHDTLWDDGLINIGTPDPDIPVHAWDAELWTSTLDSLVLRQQLRNRHRATLAIEFVDSADDILEFVEDDRVATLLRRLSPRLADILRSDILLPARDPLWAEHRDVTFGFRFEIERDGLLVATARAWYAVVNDRLDGPVAGSMPPLWSAELLHVPFHWIDGEPESFDGTWTLRIIGDPHVALRNFDATRCWVGEVVLPLNGSGRRREQR